MTVTVEELEKLKSIRSNYDLLIAWDNTTVAHAREILALAIHGLNCQAAGITAERLGDIQMVPVIDMDEVRA